ncbi:hypothetical protein GUJ93_ZPchr0008g12434 [Zizania palustris]|uniref:Uncharacterized protein n=1 Tax=Zizania palustris TaxID=103762 RepID=A0A8J5R6C7_ZIZPA|nr:hypothetical protein GUJ93_ZPchr0008g12434 [Zizania palustris]
MVLPTLASRGTPPASGSNLPLLRHLVWSATDLQTPPSSSSCNRVPNVRIFCSCDIDHLWTPCARFDLAVLMQTANCLALRRSSCLRSCPQCCLHLLFPTVACGGSSPPPWWRAAAVNPSPHPPCAPRATARQHTGIPSLPQPTSSRRRAASQLQLRPDRSARGRPTATCARRRSLRWCHRGAEDCWRG